MRDLTNYEYEAQLQRMTDKLRDAAGWGDAFDSSMGQRLIRLITDATDNLHFMLERRSTERYLTAAKLRSSVLARATELGYRAKRAIGHYGTVRLVLDRPAEHPIQIPIFTPLESDSDLILTSESVTILEGQSQIDIRVKMGEYVKFTFAEEVYEEDSEVLIEDFEMIDNETLIVKDRNRTYQDVAFDATGAPVRRAMTFLDTTDNFYDIRYSHDGMRVILGDGFFGRKPQGELTVEGIIVGDLNRQILTVDTLFEIGEIRDQEGFLYEGEVRNIDPIRFGQEPEDTEVIRERAIEYHKTNGRAVTSGDFNFWLGEARIAGIVDSRAFGEREMDKLVHTMNNVYITYLTETGEEISIEEEQRLRNFLDPLKMVTTHLVINAAKRLFIGARLYARKNPALEIPNSEFYNILKTFLDNYFQIRRGSIGREIQHSEIIRELHRINFRQDNFDLPLVDYVRLDLDGYYPITVPNREEQVNVVLDDEYSPSDGDKFVLNLDNISCETTVQSDDSFLDIMERMRDDILEKTPLIASIGFRDLIVDAFGNPLTVEVDNRTGVGFIVGIETPYFSNRLLVDRAVVGSAQARLAVGADEISVTHTYYSMPAGRRPIIALRTGSIVGFTAPTDTDVIVYQRDSLTDFESETVLTTVQAGTPFEEEFFDRGALQLEYVSDSQEDIVVDIFYPEFKDFGFALDIRTRDNFGTFSIRSNSGDISDFVNVESRIFLPVEPSLEQGRLLIIPESLEIVDQENNTLYTSNEDGTLVRSATSQESPSGRIQWTSGMLMLPNSLPAGDYYVKYQQNKFENFIVQEDTAIQMLEISPTEDNPNPFSVIEVTDEIQNGQ